MAWHPRLEQPNQPASLPAAAFNGQLLIDAKCTSQGVSAWAGWQHGMALHLDSLHDGGAATEVACTVP